MKLFILFLILISASISYADYYVVNTENKIVARMKYKPDQKDLDSREEIYLEIEEDIEIEEAEYRGGKVVKRIETTKEKEDKKEKADYNYEHNLIHKESDRINDKIACESLVAKGVVLKIIKCSDFD